MVTKGNYGLPSCFTSSTAALEWAKDHEVDLAIVDYNMPAPNGLEFVRAFRAMNDKEFVPVLMVTADHAKEVRYAALDVGVNDFLTKPLDAAEFSARHVLGVFACLRFRHAGAHRGDRLRYGVESVSRTAHL